MRGTPGIVALLVLGLVVAGCAGNESTAPTNAPIAEPSGYAEADAIPAEIREQIGDVERGLLDSFESGDPSVLRGLLAAPVLAEIESGPGLAPMFESLRRRLTGSGTERYYDLYLTEVPGDDEPVRITSSTQPAFVLEFQAPGNESYVALRGVVAGIRTMMLGVIYGRDGGTDDWRIYNLRLGQLKVSYRDAMNWYSEATGLEGQGRLLPAMMRLQIASELLHPAPFFRYVDEQKILDLQDRVATQLESGTSFPLEIPDLPGSPRVLAFEPAFLEAVVSIHVNYVTGGPLEQTAIDAEVARLRERLSAQFEGLCFGVKRIAFTAFREAPTDAGRQYESIDALADCPAES